MNEGIISILIAFIGGLAMFIYGMTVMANGLQKAAGARMKKLLGILTTNKALGVLVGVLVTGIIQSSSATTVMVVGFVNAGLMNLTQAVGVIMGANIGTTVTGWLVSSIEWAEYLQPTVLAPVAVAIGVVLAFVKNDKLNRIGEIVIGFGLLFVGIDNMAKGVEPLADSPFFREMFITLGKSPLLGILAGAAVTGIIQSSSASVGILQTLAIAGLVPWNSAVYIIMGQNIGTCVTAILSSIGASRTAKSAAYVHLIFNIIGSVIFSIVAVVMFRFVIPQLGGQLISAVQIGMVHTLFNILCTLMLFPFSNGLIYLATKMASLWKSGKADEGVLIHLDDRVLETPTFAVQSAVEEVKRMGGFVLESLKLAGEIINDDDEAKVAKILSREETIDLFEEAITQYLVKICSLEISEEENRIITSLFHTISDLERIGDHCENIAENVLYSIQEGFKFSDAAQEDLKQMIEGAYETCKNALIAFEKMDAESARAAVKAEDLVDDLEEEFRVKNIQRLTENMCDPKAGVIFLDIVTNLERISDHSLNIAQYVLTSLRSKKRRQHMHIHESKA